MIPAKILRTILENLEISRRQAGLLSQHQEFREGALLNYAELGEAIAWLQADQYNPEPAQQFREVLTAVWGMLELTGQVFGCIRGALDPATDTATSARLFASAEEQIATIVAKHAELLPKIPGLISADKAVGLG